MDSSPEKLTVHHFADAVRERPEFYIRGGWVSAASLALRVLEDIFRVSGRGVAFRVGPWMVVAAEADWIEQTRGRFSVEEALTRLTPAPFNSVNAQGVIHAFSQRLVTTTRGGEYYTVLGEPPQEDLVGEVGRSFPNWQRLLAFEIDPAYDQELAFLEEVRREQQSRR